MKIFTQKSIKQKVIIVRRMGETIDGLKRTLREYMIDTIREADQLRRTAGVDQQQLEELAFLRTRFSATFPLAFNEQIIEPFVGGQEVPIDDLENRLNRFRDMYFSYVYYSTRLLERDDVVNNFEAPIVALRNLRQQITLGFNSDRFTNGGQQHIPHIPVGANGGQIVSSDEDVDAVVIINP